MNYKIIDEYQAEEVAKLVTCLTHEIVERTGIKHFDIDAPLATDLCKSYVANGLYDVLAAFDDNQIVGFGAICESHSLYAEGAFGIIQEFYVIPEYRSKEVGKSLLREIIKFAKTKGWKRLELCTPPIPEFDRTVEFYQSNGFKITGGYKMKYAIA
ncbi:MAG: GNAT family N-acetyltransferase [Gammaproteobacteria bacterium]|nr:GNAT family N-acetyltransferase [Gammaproteobacteria bacterium]